MLFKAVTTWCSAVGKSSKTNFASQEAQITRISKVRSNLCKLKVNTCEWELTGDHLYLILFSVIGLLVFFCLYSAKNGASVLMETVDSIQQGWGVFCLFLWFSLSLIFALWTFYLKRNQNKMTDTCWLLRKRFETPSSDLIFSYSRG